MGQGWYLIALHLTHIYIYIWTVWRDLLIGKIIADMDACVQNGAHTSKIATYYKKKKKCDIV